MNFSSTTYSRSFFFQLISLVFLDCFHASSSFFSMSLPFFDPNLKIFFFFLFPIAFLLFSSVFNFKCFLALTKIFFFITFFFWLYYFDSTSNVFYFSNSFNFFDFFYFDAFSYSLVGLTIFLYCLIFFYYEFTMVKPYFFSLLLIISFYTLVITFLVSRVFHFYIFFEALLLPFFFIISVWGSNLNRIWAAERLLFFTLFFSTPFFFFLIKFIFPFQMFSTFDFFFSSSYFNISSSFFIAFFFFVSLFLGVKIPLFPMHIWLPEAHGEAPTIGSMLLAGLLLKLGSYGFFRFLYFSGFQNFFSDEFFLFFYFLCIFSIFSSLLSLFFQTDFKKAIAYFSIAHISYVVLGLLTGIYEGILGSFIITLSHGLSATLLFFLVGFLYNQSHTRSLNFYSQLAQKIPLFSLFFFLASLANISLPGTAGFVGEQLVLFSLFSFDFQILLLPGFFTFFSGLTGIIFCFRLLYGTNKRVFVFQDLSFYDFIISFLLIAPVFIVGFFPSLVF